MLRNRWHWWKPMTQPRSLNTIEYVVPRKAYVFQYMYILLFYISIWKSYRYRFFCYLISQNAVGLPCCCFFFVFVLLRSLFSVFLNSKCTLVCMCRCREYSKVFLIGGQFTTSCSDCLAIFLVAMWIEK